MQVCNQKVCRCQPGMKHVTMVASGCALGMKKRSPKTGVRISVQFKWALIHQNGKPRCRHDRIRPRPSACQSQYSSGSPMRGSSPQDLSRRMPFPAYSHLFPGPPSRTHYLHALRHDSRNEGSRDDSACFPHHFTARMHVAIITTTCPIAAATLSSATVALPSTSQHHHHAHITSMLCTTTLAMRLSR